MFPARSNATWGEVRLLSCGGLIEKVVGLDLSCRGLNDPAHVCQRRETRTLNPQPHSFIRHAQRRGKIGVALIILVEKIAQFHGLYLATECCVRQQHFSTSRHNPSLGTFLNTVLMGSQHFWCGRGESKHGIGESYSYAA